MKYWILTTEYPPQYGGGIGTYVYHTARMLRDKGHQVTVFLNDISLSADQVSEEEGIRLVRFVPNKTVSRQMLGYNASISYEYATIIKEYIKKEGKPAIIESQEYHAIAYYLQQFKWLGYEEFAGIPMLITCHAPSFLCLEYNHVPVYQLPYYWTGQMEKASMHCADLLISPSRYFIHQAKQRMDWQAISEHYVVNPIETIKCPVPSFKEASIVCFGKLSPLKGTFELLKYFKNLWDDGFACSLSIVGSTQQLFHPEGLTMGEIVKKKYSFYINKGLLRMEGDLSPAKAKEKLLEAQVIIVPSIVDNLPYTVLEAMSWGKLVLASQQGGQSELIKDGKNGFLFDHYTENDFEKKLHYILSAGKEELGEIMKNAMQTIYDQCSYDAVYDRKMELINKFLSSQKQSTQFPFPFRGLPCHTAASNYTAKNQLLSIVIPYYNMGSYIEECVQSVLAATYPSKEIIIINDGSSDKESITVLDQIERKYPVKVYHKKNEGLSMARNFGAGKASGYYMAFLDADDTVDETYYSKAINVLKTLNNIHFVGCWTRYTGLGKGYWPAFNPEPPYLLVHNMINSSSLVYKKDSFLNYGLNAPELVYGMEDWESVINMVENNANGVVLPEPLFNYRVRKDSMTRSFTRIKQLHLYRLIGERHKKLYAIYGNEVAQLLNSNGSGLYFDNPSFEPAAIGWIPSLPFSGQFKEKVKRIMKRNKYTREIAYKIYKQLKN